jgi:trehalose/maltose hydrolase-like predicted phosphorylase
MSERAAATRASGGAVAPARRNVRVPRSGRLVAALAGALLLTLASGVLAQSDPSFTLTAGLEDLPAYFPGYLGNGYLSTLTAPRGTEATRAYLAAFMDYTSGDVSRPAAIPGWTETDFSSDGGHTWLNRAPLNAQHFKDYRQTLDLRAATLTSSYRFADHGRETAIEVTSFVSEAAPHLAVMQFRMTPDYDGTVQLSFALRLWAQHEPRFPLAQMTGSEMEQALAAHGLSLEPRAPATADREAIWYPGYTEVLASDGDTGTLSLWLDGRARQGAAMAMAASVALPESAATQSVTLRRERYRLALDVALKVTRGHTYVFTKYVAVSRAGWGGTGTEDLALARQAREHGFAQLLEEQRAAWEALWQSDVLIEGDARAQQAVHSELYYLLSTSSTDTAWGAGACALTPGYLNHVFWDSDTWIFPALLLLHPQRAKSLVDFRERTLEPARERARQRGFAGAMFPWESDPENGSEQTPHFAYILGESEIHVNADVAIAQWQYYLATQDKTWLRTHGWPVIREVARFWASRATYDPTGRYYAIAHVNSVAESHTDIANDTFTNLSAAKALNIATAAAGVLGEHAEPLWERVARGLYIPMAPGGAHHLSFPANVAQTDEDFGGGSLALLFLPSLDLIMSAPLRRADYDYGVRSASLALVAAVPMGIAPRTIAAVTAERAEDAAASFDSNFTGGTLKPPFNVRTETAANNTGYFLTGSGGYLQSLLYGFTGLRIREAGLVATYPPVLPATWKSLTLRNLSFRGQHLDIRLAREDTGAVRLTRTVH